MLRISIAAFFHTLDKAMKMPNLEEMPVEGNGFILKKLNQVASLVQSRRQRCRRCRCCPF